MDELIEQAPTYGIGFDKNVDVRPTLEIIFKEKIPYHKSCYIIEIDFYDLCMKKKYYIKGIPINEYTEIILFMNGLFKNGKYDTKMSRGRITDIIFQKYQEDV